MNKEQEISLNVFFEDEAFLNSYLEKKLKTIF